MYEPLGSFAVLIAFDKNESDRSENLQLRALPAPIHSPRLHIHCASTNRFSAISWHRLDVKVGMQLDRL